eukprot:6479768-Amphidinium_carterae.1
MREQGDAGARNDVQGTERLAVTLDSGAEAHAGPVELLSGLAWKKDFYKSVPTLVGANGSSLGPKCWACVDYLMGGKIAGGAKEIHVKMRTEFLACEGLDRVYLSVSKLAEAGIETVMRSHDPHLLVNTKEVVAFYGEAIKVPIFKHRGLWQLDIEPKKT